MPARCVGAGRSWRGVWSPWARRWNVRMFRGYGVRRRARSSVQGVRCANGGRLEDGRRPWGRTTEPAVPTGVNKAFGIPRTSGSVEAAVATRAVWVNGALGEPEVVGPAGSVWVTRSDKEEPDGESPPSCERKGRPRTLGHESILELWLKVQAMRVASGCWGGSRVELHPVPAGEGPVEKGLPGRASWLETSQGGVTGPWVRGRARAFPRASGLPSAREIGAGCDRVSILCRQGQAGKTPPAVGGPGVVENIGCAAMGPWEKRQTMGVPEAIGCSEALKRPIEREVRECGGTPGLCCRGHSVQVSGALEEEPVYGHMLWERGQIVGASDALMVLPRAMEDETTPQGGLGLWQRRQEVEDTGSRAMAQPVGVSCAREDGARCGNDPGSWGAAQAAGLSASEEQETGSQGATGLWGIEQAMGAPRALGKESDDARVPGQWGTGQLPSMQTGVVSGDWEEAGYDASGLWERQQALGPPLAEPLPGPAVEETHCGSLLSLWERGQVMREQEAQGPAALGLPGAVDQDASCGVLSCPCGRRRAVELMEAVVRPKLRCATGAPSALGVPAATLWVCQESSSTDGVNLSETTHIASAGPMAPEECSSMVEDAKSRALPGSWGRRPAIGVPVAPQVPGSLEVEAGSRGFSGMSGRRQAAGIPVTAGVSPAGVGVAPWASSSVWEHTGSRSASDSVGGRPPTCVSMTVGLPESTVDETLCEGLQRRQCVPVPGTAGIATTVGEPSASGLCGPRRVVDSGGGESSEIRQRRQMTEVPAVCRAPELEREAGSDSVSDPWRRNSGTVSEAMRGALHQEMLTAVGVPVVGCVPAAVWVTGSPGEEANEGDYDMTVARGQSMEGVSRGILRLAGRGQAVGVSYTHELGARMWGSPRPSGEETACETMPRVPAVRAAGAAASREEVGLGHFRDDLQGSGQRVVEGVPEARARETDLGEREEGGLRGTFQ